MSTRWMAPGHRPGDGQGPRSDATVTAKTELRDDSSRDDGVFGLAEIVAGDWIELDGFEDSDGDVTALKIERFDPDPDPADRKVSVEGIVDGRDPALEILNLLGILFDTSTATFDGVGDLTGITPDDIVEVTWTDDVAFTQAPPGHPVDEVELEEDRTP